MARDEHEYVTEKMYVTRRKDSHYTHSRKVPGEFSPNTRSDAESDPDQVTMSHISGEDAGSEADSVAEAHSSTYRTEAQRQRDELAEIIVQWLLDLAVEHGTRYAIRLWIEKLRPAIHIQVERRRKRRALRKQRQAEDEGSVTESHVVQPPRDLAGVAAEFKTNMTSSEAQTRYLIALAAQRFAEEQMRLLADVDIRADEAYEELQHALSGLPSGQVIRMLQKLEVTPDLLTGDALTALGLFLGVARVNGPTAIEVHREH